MVNTVVDRRLGRLTDRYGHVELITEADVFRGLDRDEKIVLAVGLRRRIRHVPGGPALVRGEIDLRVAAADRHLGEGRRIHRQHQFLDVLAVEYSVAVGITIQCHAAVLVSCQRKQVGLGREAALIAHRCDDLPYVGLVDEQPLLERLRQQQRQLRLRQLRQRRTRLAHDDVV